MKIINTVPFHRCCLAVALFLAMQLPAWAHAYLYYSIPKDGSTVTNSPPKIRICFTEHLKLHGSTIQVRNTKGKEVDKKDSYRGYKDPSLLFVSLPKLPAGTYTVTWHALAQDNDRTKGRFKFTIKPATEK